jgi:Cytochrome bd terminal oxidase subunit II
LVEGLQVTSHQYAGGPFSWLSPFSILCGFGLCVGYMLLGASWLIYKTTAEVQSVAPVHSSEAPGRGPRLSRRASRANLPVGRSSDGDGNVGDRGVAQHLSQ